MKKVIPFVLLAVLVFQYSFSQNPYIVRLNDNWQFLRSDIGGIWEAVRPVNVGTPESVPLWQKIALPHCFNATDAVDPDVNYYQGPGWYKTELEIKNPFPKGRILLHFEGAGQKTEVYIYTNKVGSHVGGCDEWTIDITDAVNSFLSDKKNLINFKGKVPLSIRCDNSRDLEMIPSDLSDFNIYGGIYRYLNLKYLPAVALERLLIDPTVDAKGIKGALKIVLKTSNKSDIQKGILSLEITDPKGKLILKSSQEIDADNTEKSVLNTTLKAPMLWSPSSPNLYTCKATIRTALGTQTITERFGFRNFEFIKKGPFLLNGKRLLLRGTHRHEDHAGVGAAMTESQIRTELLLMKEMGVNFLRSGHYQQSRIALSLCDSLGILVWEEIPWCRGGLGGENYKAQARRMLTNMITQHYNHPSIIIWGLGNENDWPGDFSEFDKDKIRSFMKELHQLSHQLDAGRKTAIRRCEFCKDVVDVYSPSIWAGWYRGKYTEYKEESHKNMLMVNHFLHVEYGGDSHAGRHDEEADTILSKIQSGKGVDERAGDASLEGGEARVSKDGNWSESYIVNLFDWHLKEQEKMPWLTGAAQWVFKDFSTPVRPDNPVPYVNQKGVVERDFTKKESYYVFQSYWTEKPMLHIYGHSWPVRWGNEGEEKMVKVYSNCPEVELFLNGKSMGIKKRNSQNFPAAGLHWNVTFAKGKNEIVALTKNKGNVIRDTITFDYQTEKWGKPTQFEVKEESIDKKNSWMVIKAYDDNKILCLDSRIKVRFSAIGDVKMIDNQGTSSGSRLVELINGVARIKLVKTGLKYSFAVQSEGIPTVVVTN